jgi:hypothetical protein
MIRYGLTGNSKSPAIHLELFRSYHLYCRIREEKVTDRFPAIQKENRRFYGGLQINQVFYQFRSSVVAATVMAIITTAATVTTATITAIVSPTI